CTTGSPPRTPSSRCPVGSATRSCRRPRWPGSPCCARCRPRRAWPSTPPGAPRPPRRSLWVGFRPYGVGETKPNHYGEILRIVWANRDNLRYAWRILRRGVCDGCALGVAGFHDWTIDGVHLCTTRLTLLRVNTMGALDPARLADVAALRARSGAELRALGRLGQ